MVSTFHVESEVEVEVELGLELEVACPLGFLMELSVAFHIDHDLQRDLGPHRLSSLGLRCHFGTVSLLQIEFGWVAFVWVGLDPIV